MVKKVNRGYLSENFIVRNKDRRFFLKQYRFTVEASLKEIYSVMHFFARQNIPVILPLKNVKNCTYFKFGNSFYSIFPFIEGKQFEKQKMSDEAIIDCGRFLAQFHLQSKFGSQNLLAKSSFTWENGKFNLRISNIEKAIDQIYFKSDFDIKAERLIKQKIQITRTNKIFPKNLMLKSDHLIHGDYHQDNIFFTKDDKVEHLFDWEKANIAPRAIEIAQALESICFQGSHEDINYIKAKCFLDEYCKKYPIGNLELKSGMMAWYLIQVYDLWIFEEHYLKNNIRIDSMINMQCEFINYYCNNLRTHISKIQRKRH